MVTVLKEEFLSPRSYKNETDFVYDADELEELTGDPVIIPSNWGEKEAPYNYKHSKEDLKQIIP